MKNFIIVFITLLFSVTLIAQPIIKPGLKKGMELKKQKEYFQKNQSQLRHELKNIENEKKFIADLTADRVDSIIVTSEYGTFLYRFTYTSKGFVSNYIKKSFEGGVWESIRQVLFTYNSQDLVTIQLNKIWEDGAWVNSSCYTNTYNSQGAVVSTMAEYADSTGQLQKSSLTTNTFNNAGLVIIQLEQYWGDTGWENSFRSKYEHNSLGLTTSRISESWENGVWVYASSAYYTYTDCGAPLETIGDYLSLATWEVRRLRLTNNYDAQKNLIRELTEVLKDSVWNLSERTNYQYEANGFVVKRLLSSWYGTAWVDSMYLVDTLHSDKIRNLTYHESNWVNGSWVPTYRLHWNYNPKDKLNSVIQELYDNGQWGLDYKEEYTYDATGELLTFFDCGFYSNGVRLSYDYQLYLNIDSNALSSLYLSCQNVKIWYKKVTVPVELASFTALPKDGFVQLKWQTATETNNKGFDVERKTAESQWVKIGFVQGNGTIAESRNYSFIDKNSTTEKCHYRLKQIDFDGTVNYSPEIEVTSNIIKSYSLGQNYPNPFNPSTSISFAVPKESRVSLKIYNSVGQQVKELVSGVKPAGSYNLRFDASMLSSGVYFYTIEATSVDGSENFRNTRKMLLVK